ncbi:MAG: hypothetical protein CMB67_02395 [Euryarchaeota archaeon]|nr:hypothetical protein [Euryarchaeota archaeon]
MESRVEVPCHICASEGTITMMSHSSEIPYFGEHTQITMICSKCGWKNTDFIPSDGEKPGYSSLRIDDEEKLSSRVVRSSSCTIRIPQLNLEVSPGASSSGYITNIEGVISRFSEAASSIYRSGDSEEITNQALEIISDLDDIRKCLKIVDIELLDPMGRSRIIHNQATSRELTEDENSALGIGPQVPIYE